MTKKNNYEIDEVLLNEEFYIAHKIDTSHFMEHPHFHNGFEIHFTLTNNTIYFIEGKKYVSDSGTVTLINSEEIHRVCIDKNKLYERYFILFKPSFIEFITVNYPEVLEIFVQKNKMDKNCIQLSSNDQDKMKNLVEELLKIYIESDLYLYELRIKQKFLELLIFLSDIFNFRNGDYIRVNYEQQDQLIKIIKYMRKNSSKELCLDLLCEHFYISKSSMIRLFKKYIGMTPNQYLIYLRIMNSRKYLESGYNVKEVSIKVGYSDISSFIKKFKEIQGLSPKKYAMSFKADNIEEKLNE